MKRLLLVLVSAAALAALSLPCGSAVAVAPPTLFLTPSSGDAPSVSGDLVGTDWTCDGGAPIGTATASGIGVTGSADINRDGSLTGGSFTIRGRAGDVVVVTLTADALCPGTRDQHLLARATFTFNVPTPAPTRTRVPSPVPTSTPTPLPATVPPSPGVTPPAVAPTSSAASPSPNAGTPTATPSPGATPTPAQAPPGSQLLLFDGCVPASPVSLEFVPLYLVGSEQPDPKATGPGFAVPAVQTSDGAGPLAFKAPDVEPGRLFRVTPKGDDGECSPDPRAPAAYWMSGEPVLLKMRLKSETTLEVCLPGDVSPCEYPEVKGAFIHRGELPSMPDDSAAAVAASGWGIDKQFFAEDLKKQKQRFRSTTNLAVAGSGKLQASVLPFPKGAEGDPSTVPGLVASWDIGCVNCEFTVDLSSLAPASKSSGNPWYKSAFDVVAKPFKAAGNGVGFVFGKIGDLLGIGGDDKKSEPVMQAGKPQIPEAKPGDNLVAGALNPLLQPTTFYFRLLLPLESNPDANAASNAVRLQQVDKPPPIKLTNPTPTSTPTESPYEVHITGYHGIVPPLNPNKVCYVATQDAWPKTFMPPMVYTTKKSEAYVTGTSLDVHAGDLICEPDPHEPDIFEAIMSWAEYVVDWASQAWSDLKAFAVDVVLKYTPLGALCTSVEKSGKIPSGACTTAFNMALDATLLAAGVPPDIPNFHEMMNLGIDYVAAQAAAQVGIPPEVVDAAVKKGGPYAGYALDEAEDKLRDELQAQIKAKLGDVAKSIELANAKAVSWVPDGIPVRPDGYLPPAASLVVKRKPGIPGGDDGCSLTVRDKLTISKETLDSPPAGYEWVTSLPHELSQLTSYDLLGDEAGLGVDKALSVPPLAQGESFTIPMTFRPNYYKSGWSPLGLIKATQYISVWYFLHETGMLRLSVQGSCGSTKLDVPAKASVVGAQVVP